jgi:hypothetical protein
VEIDGEIVEVGNPIDRVVARRRKILQTIDATAMIRAFAKWNARQVMHLWNMPEKVKEYIVGTDSLASIEVIALAAKSAEECKIAARDALEAYAHGMAFDGAFKQIAGQKSLEDEDNKSFAARAAYYSTAQDVIEAAQSSVLNSAYAIGNVRILESKQREQFRIMVDEIMISRADLSVKELDTI